MAEMTGPAAAGDRGAPLLEVSDLRVRRGGEALLERVSVTVARGSLHLLVGPNGAGKSTLLKSILDLTPKLSGTINVLGKPFAANRKQIAYVPQRSSIDWDFPTTVIDLVVMGTYGRLGWFRRPGKQERADSMADLDRLGMTEYADRQINELSGGQQQRACLLYTSPSPRDQRGSRMPSSA